MTGSAAAVSPRTPPDGRCRDRELIDSTAMSEALSRAGLRRQSDSHLVLERGWPLPKIPLMLRCLDPDAQEKRGRWWSLHFIGPRGLPFAHRAALKRRHATWVEALGAVVQSFPDDLLLEGVWSAISSSQAFGAITRGTRRNGRGWDGLTARVLSYKPGRRLTIRYRLSRSQGRGRTLFGKALPPGSDLEAFGIQRALEEAASRDRLVRLTLPRLAGRVPEWNMLLWRRLPGRSLFEMLEAPELMEVAALAGCCLAELHCSSTEWRRVHDRRRELATTRSWVRAVDVASPAAGLELRRIERLLGRSLASSRRGSLVPSHRDFYDKQIVVHDGRAALLDLETASRAEPELDVANFLAHLRLRELQGRELDSRAVAAAFLESYSRGFRKPNRRRLGGYLASSLLRLACVYSFRIDGSGLSKGLRGAAEQAARGDCTVSK